MADIARIAVPEGKTFDIKDISAIFSVSLSGRTLTVTKRDGTVTQYTTVDSTYTASDAAPSMDGKAASGASESYSRADHVHPSDTTKANVASPTFTGTPKAPTASKATKNTQLATTEFVHNVMDDITKQTLNATDDGNGNVTVTLT